MMPTKNRPGDSGFDVPVEDPSGDLLGMSRHAGALAHYIRRHTAKLPFTVGILGEWGEGKTSFVYILRHYLSHPGGEEEARPIKFVYFSAWAYNTTEKLWRALILKIARVLYGKEEVKTPQPEDEEGGGDGLLQRVSSFLSGDAFLLRGEPPDKFDKLVEELESTDFGQVKRRSSKAAASEEATTTALVNVAVAALSNVSPLFAWARGLLGLDAKDDAAKAFQKTNEAAHGNAEALKNFREVFGRIIREGRLPGEPVYIFIDDLDRAQPDVALDIMEAIRVVFDEDDPCVFIVAVDDRLISQGLRLRYPELFVNDPNQLGTLAAKGGEYLEKIIQFRMFLPQRTPEQVQKMIAGRYPELMAAGDIIRTVVTTNPRRIKQYCEQLIFQRMVGQDSTPPPAVEGSAPGDAAQARGGQQKKEVRKTGRGGGKSPAGKGGAGGENTKELKARKNRRGVRQAAN